MVLPSGFALPAPPYLLAIVLGVSLVAWLLYRDRPAVTEPVVLAFAPWMVVGASLHVAYQIGAAPPGIAPLLGTPAVYLSTAAVGGAVWFLAQRRRAGPAAVARRLAIVGSVLAVGAVAGVLAVAPSVRPAWSVIGLLLGGVLAAGAWGLLRRLASTRAPIPGRIGALVLFAHALDGVSTAVGVDVLGFGERTPISRLILDLAAALPTAETIGVGWLFVAVKVTLAGLVVWVFADLIRDEPVEAYLLLATVAAVGLGPGAHNLLLYAVR